MPKGPESFYQKEGFETPLDINDLLKIDGRWAQYVGGTPEELSVVYLDDPERIPYRIRPEEYEVRELVTTVNHLEHSTTEAIPPHLLDNAHHSDPDAKGQLFVRGILRKRSIH